jgi:hypothetical protein
MQHLLFEYKSLHKSLRDIGVKNGFRILEFRIENLIEPFPIECNKDTDCAILWVHFFILVQALQSIYCLIAIKEVVHTSMALEFHSKQL